MAKSYFQKHLRSKHKSKKKIVQKRKYRNDWMKFDFDKIAHLPLVDKVKHWAWKQRKTSFNEWFGPSDTIKRYLNLLKHGVS